MSTDTDPDAPAQTPEADTTKEPTSEGEAKEPDAEKQPEPEQTPAPEPTAEQRGSPPSSRVKGRTDTALQKLQMKVSNLEKSNKGITADDVRGVIRQELNSLLGDTGAGEAADTATEGLDDDAPVTRRQLNSILGKAKSEAKREVQEELQREQEQRQQLAQEAQEARQEWVEQFDDGKPEHMKGRAGEVLEAFDKRMSRFKSIDRMNVADQQALEDEQYELAYNAVEKKARAGGKKPPKKSPEGTEIVKPGASTTPAQTDNDQPELDAFGIPKGLAEDWDRQMSGNRGAGGL